jgi:hypothetical protein
MSKEIEHHVIVMNEVTGDRRDFYGILYKSSLVYRTTRSNAPTRLVVWDNTSRPFNADRAAWNTRGAYLDPHNRGTDDEISFLLSTESTVICADTSRNTGQPGSGQVYASGGQEVIGDGDTATLVYPDMTAQRVILHMPPHQNGHGTATATTERKRMLQP